MNGIASRVTSSVLAGMILAMLTWLITTTNDNHYHMRALTMFLQQVRDDNQTFQKQINDRVEALTTEVRALERQHR